MTSVRIKLAYSDSLIPTSNNFTVLPVRVTYMERNSLGGIALLCGMDCPRLEPRPDNKFSIYKRTNVMQLDSMFIFNCNIALHVSDAFCVHLQEHLETVEAASGELHETG